MNARINEFSTQKVTRHYSTACSKPELSFRQVHALVQDLKTPNMAIYWGDFLTTIVCGHLLFHLIVFAPSIFPGNESLAWGARAAAFPLTVVLYMRAAMFIHELVHLPRERFRFFRMAWNGLCGIFFLIPGFTYFPHVEHHRRHTYGTEHDGEYLSLSHRPAWYIVGFLLQSLFIPILGYLRFALISPFCWVFPKARPWVHRHMSTMVIDPFYERDDASPEVMRIVVTQEFACFVWCIILAARGIFVYGTWANPLWLTAYSLSVCLITLNAVRTLGAHRWTGDGHEMTFADQLLDTVNYPYRGWVTELWGPIGTRYHALHHLLPSIPYHNLPEAHRRLSANLPPESPYHQTNKVSLLSEVYQLWRRARASQSQGKTLDQVGNQTAA